MEAGVSAAYFICAFVLIVKQYTSNSNVCYSLRLHLNTDTQYEDCATLNCLLDERQTYTSCNGKGERKQQKNCANISIIICLLSSDVNWKSINLMFSMTNRNRLATTAGVQCTLLYTGVSEKRTCRYAKSNAISCEIGRSMTTAIQRLYSAINSREKQ